MPVFSGQGRVLLGDRTASGGPGALRLVGEIDPKGLSVDFKVDEFEVKESSSGQRGTLAMLTQAKSATVKFAFQDWNADNLAMQVLGVKIATAGGSVTNEALPAGLVVGDIVRLAHPGVSSVVLRDSATTPATLTAGTHYALDSADFGALLIKSLGSYTQPLKADYTYAAVTEVPLLKDTLRDRYLSVELMNTADGNRKVLVEFYRVNFSAGKTLDLIQEKGIATGAMEATVLVDPTKPVDSALGQFGRVVMLS